jgi:hypothetical protein
LVDRVPLTLFTHINEIQVHAAWSDPLNPTDPWTGYPYQWRVTMRVRSQTHSDPTTTRPFTYNGLDIAIGDWVVFTQGGMALEVISIISQTDSVLTVIVEDVSLHNLLNDPGQTGQGIGPVSADDIYDCLVINLNASGVPIFANLPDYSVPINLVADITNRFQFRNYVQDYILEFQAGHGFAVGDVIYLDAAGAYHASIATDPGAETSVGIVTSINQPNVGSFTYRPMGRYVKNLPPLPGDPGQLLYVSSTIPGGLTESAPSPIAIPVYIKITDTSAIMTSGTGGGGGAAGNLSIIGNTISATNANGNINLSPNGTGTVNMPSANVGNIAATNTTITSLTPGRIVIVGPDGQLVDTGYLTYSTLDQAMSVGNVRITSEYITTSAPGEPLILTANAANVQIATTLDLTSNRIINAADPVENQDVATKSYVDAVAQGLNAKEPVLVATIGALDATFTPLVAYGSLTSNVYQRLEIDGVEPDPNARILVKDQGDEIENGIYRVVQIGGVSQPWILSRTVDFNGQGISGKVSSGDFVFVEEGGQNGGTGWVMTTPNPVTVNSSDIHWIQFSSAGVIQAGFGLTKSGTILDVNVAPIINPSTGLNTSMGPLGYKIIEINLDPSAPLEVYNGALRIKSSIAGTGLTYDPSGGNLSINNNQPTITGLGNVTSGTWSADTISIEHGGTGNTQIGLPSQALVVNDAGDGLEYQYRSKLTESQLPPLSPAPADGDRWFSVDYGILFTRITDSNGGHWVEL